MPTRPTPAAIALPAIAATATAVSADLATRLDIIGFILTGQGGRKCLAQSSLRPMFATRSLESARLKSGRSGAYLRRIRPESKEVEVDTGQSHQHWMLRQGLFIVL